VAKIFQTEWGTYRTRVMPKQVSPVQLLETRRAFYAGGASLLALMMRNLEGGEDATEADLIMMDQVHEEFQQFNRDVLSGKA
jgi:hypothetical protein